MTSNQFALEVENDRAASFWIKAAISAASTRDVLDALIDAEALHEFCALRAQECGLSAKP
jgi:hypothetical protein